MSFGHPGIGVAVVGVGGVGAEHSRAYLATGKCELRWLYDIDAAKARKVANGLGAGVVATHLGQILEDRAVRVVSIASYDDVHYPQVVAALEAGKHVFVEKPLCRTLEELEVVKRVWSKQEGKLKLSSNMVLRAAPLYRWVKRKIESGDVGQCYAFDGDYLYGRLNKITRGWRHAVEDYSVMLGGGVHLVDLLLWWAGERPATVHAAGNRICTEASPFRYPDYVASTLGFPSGLVGRISANFGCVHRHQHLVRLFGTQATFVHDDAGPRWHWTRDPSARPSPLALAPLPKDKGGLIAPFVEAVLADADIGAHTQEIFDVISACIASDESLKLGRAVEVRYV